MNERSRTAVHLNVRANRRDPLGIKRQSGLKFLRLSGDRVLLVAPLFLSTFFSKLSVPGLAERGISIAIPLILILTLFGVLAGRLVVQPRTAVLYVACIGTMLFMQIFSAATYSLPSLLFLLLLFMPCALTLADNAGRTDQLSRRGLDALSDFGLLFAIAGVVQYSLQFVLSHRFAFPIENLLPSGFLIEGFNYLNKLEYSSLIYKSNGLFFQEPSFFSQFTAAALLLELTMKLRMGRILAYLAALVVTFSGTGLIVLGAGVFSLLVEKRQWKFFFGFILSATALVVVVSFLPVDLFLSRASEVSSPGSSGFERFAAWLYMFDQHWFPADMRVIFGAGAGTFADYANRSPFSVAELSFSKIFFEYGLVGGVLFFGMMMAAVAMSRIPMPLMVGLFVSFLMNGPYSVSALGLLLTVVIWPGLKNGRRTTDVPRALPA